METLVDMHINLSLNISLSLSLSRFIYLYVSLWSYCNPSVYLLAYSFTMFFVMPALSVSLGDVFCSLVVVYSVRRFKCPRSYIQLQLCYQVSFDAYYVEGQHKDVTSCFTFCLVGTSFLHASWKMVIQCSWLNGAWEAQTSERKVAKHVRNEKCKWRNAFICRGDKKWLGIRFESFTEC